MKRVRTGLVVYLLSCLLAACDFTSATGPGSSRPEVGSVTPIPTSPTAVDAPVVQSPVVPHPAALVSPSPPTSAPPSADPTAGQAYLQAALDYMQQNYARRAQVDWAAWRQQIAQALPPPRNVAEAYTAIRYAMHMLGDPHLQFFPPDEVKGMLEQDQVVGLGLLPVYPERVVVTVDAGGAAAHAGVRVGDRIDRINDASAITMTSDAFFTALFAGSRVHLLLGRSGSSQALSVVLDHAEYHYPVVGPQGQRLPDAIGYIELPGLSAMEPIFHQYAGLAQQHIRDIDQTATCGWILDMRGNTGGDMWDMLAGIGPILGEGAVGAFVYPSGQRESWVYRNGQAWKGEEVWAHVDHPYQMKQPLPPVAVLTDAQTASAGEAVVVAFQGRPSTRSFGQPTTGLPTHRDAKTLSDGAWLFVTLALDADRSGRIYDGPIAPDQTIHVIPKLVGTEQDPVVLAAQAWLRAQPTCSTVSNHEP